MAKVYKLSAPNLVPYFSNEGRYLHAVIAVGVSKAGENHSIKDSLTHMQRMRKVMKKVTLVMKHKQTVTWK